MIPIDGVPLQTHSSYIALGVCSLVQAILLILPWFISILVDKESCVEFIAELASATKEQQCKGNTFFGFGL